MRNSRCRAIVFVVSTMAGAACASSEADPSAVGRPPPLPESKHLTITPDSLLALEPELVAARGTDFLSPRYDPGRLGIPLEELDIVHQYDFERVAAIENELLGVDRRPVLGAIFDRITRGIPDDTGRHLAVLTFLQKAGINHMIQPMYADGAMVTDPLVLLWLNEMRCGHVARVAVDLFEAAGYDARLVQLGGHVIAEVQYEEDWHYLDADVFGGGSVVRDPDGTIPSVAELSHAPWRIDLPLAYAEAFLSPGSDGEHQGHNPPYPSYFYFSAAAADELGPRYYRKTASPEELKSSRHYGWDHIEVVPAPEIILYDDIPLRYSHSVRIVGAERLDDGRFLLEWEPSVGPEAGVRFTVFVGSTTRGWNYDSIEDSASLSEFWEGSWDPTMYDWMFTRPPADVAELTTHDSTAVLGPFPDAVYVSVMARDAYGDSLGKGAYVLSEELVLRPDSTR